MNAHQRYMQYRKDELYHFNPNHDPKDGRFTSAKGIRAALSKVKKAFQKWDEQPKDPDRISPYHPTDQRFTFPAPEYEQKQRDDNMSYAASYREFQLMYQEQASDDTLDYWERSDYQSWADDYKRRADSNERLAKANDEVYRFKPSKDEKRLDKANRALSKLKRFDEPAPDVTKTKPGSNERLRALDTYNLQRAVESSSGDWYNGEPKSARWKKIYKNYKNGKEVAERDLAEAALLDMGYKATPENIDYLIKRHVIFWD